MELQFAEMLTSKIYMDYIKDPFNEETTMKYLKETLPSLAVKALFNRAYHHMEFPTKNLHMMLAPLKNKCIILKLDTSMHTSLCQDWFITCH